MAEKKAFCRSESEPSPKSPNSAPFRSWSLSLHCCDPFCDSLSQLSGWRLYHTGHSGRVCLRNELYNEPLALTVLWTSSHKSHNNKAWIQRDPSCGPQARLCVWSGQSKRYKRKVFRRNDVASDFSDALWSWTFSHTVDTKNLWYFYDGLLCGLLDD